jgi:Holliday junction resolvase
METNAMPNTRYRSGVNLEREIRQILEESFNIPCLRTAGSKGAFDLVALGRRTILIQVKYTKKKNLEPSRELIQSLKKYCTDERWAIIIVVQRQTRLTNITWIVEKDYWFDYYGLCSYNYMTVSFDDAMGKLNQLCSGYEVNNP